MTFDTSVSPISPISTPESPPPRCKYRVRFRKAGDLRLVSHHDLMHVCERMFRRADLDIPVTQGFNPRPRMWFASAMALGIAGLNEVLEFELTSLMPDEEVHQRLTRQAPPGMGILSVRAIDVKTSARIRRAIYRLWLREGGNREGEAPAEPFAVGVPPSGGGARLKPELPPEPLTLATSSAGGSPSRASLASAFEKFMAQTECWVERLRPHPRRINVRPFVHELHAHDDRLELALWITSNGAARPDEIIAALGLTELLDAGAVIERTDLEVYDELPPGTEGPPLIESAIEEISANDRELPEPGAARPTPIISNPMSFDS